MRKHELLEARLAECCKLKYVGDCKCGDCQLVPLELICDVRRALIYGDQAALDDLLVGLGVLGISVAVIVVATLALKVLS